MREFLSRLWHRRKRYDAILIDFVNAQTRIYHSRTEVGETFKPANLALRLLEMRGQASSESSIVEHIEQLPGVVACTAPTRYTLIVSINPCFTWDEIEPDIFAALTFRLEPAGA